MWVHKGRGETTIFLVRAFFALVRAGTLGTVCQPLVACTVVRKLQSHQEVGFAVHVDFDRIAGDKHGSAVTQNRTAPALTLRIHTIRREQNWMIRCDVHAVFDGVHAMSDFPFAVNPP